MRTEQILYLSALHEHASINAAAQVLHISPQALSLSMNHLEEEIGLPLLSRTRFGTTLTPHGLQLLNDGLVFIDAVNALKNSAAKKYPQLSGAQIHLLVTAGVLESTVFPDVLSRIYIDYPDFTIRSQRMKYSDILEHLSSQADLGIIYSLSVNHHAVTDLTDTPYEFVPLMSGKYYCIAHPNFPIYRYNSVSIKTMLKYPHILYTPSKGVLNALFQYADPNAKHNIISVDDYSVYNQMIVNGAGLGLVLITTKNPLPPANHLKLIPFKEKIHSSVGYIYNKNKPFSAPTQAFIDYLSEFFQKSKKAF